MTHIAYDRLHYDSSTKTLHKSTPMKPIVRGPKAWEVDPQLQIIRLLTDIKILLGNQLKRTAPYHTGPQQVVIAAPSDPAVPSPPLLLPESDSKAPQGDGKVSEVPEPPK